MTIKISIIIPVYNLAELLPRCVDSVLAQSFNDFELILVNDGSTDNSGELCDEYAEQDSRVRVIHKENGGVAFSRNTGLDAAKGMYIGFVDNDDFIHEKMFEILYHHAVAHGSDIVACDFVRVNENESVDTKQASADYAVQHFNHIEALHQIYSSNSLTFICPWNKLYKKSLFHGIRYEAGSINDDETVVHKLLYNSKKTTYIHTGLYYYVQREGSQMHAAFHIKRLSAVYALKGREVYFRKIKLPELHQKALKHYMDKFFWYYYLAKSSSTGIDKELKELKRTFDKSLFHLVRLKEIGWKQKAMCVLFSISPSLFEFIKDTNAKKQQSRIG